MKNLFHQHQLKLVFLLGLTLSALFSVITYDWEQRAITNNFRLVASTYKAAILHEVGLHLEMVDSTGSLMDAAPNVTQDGFTNFVERHFQYHIDIDSVYWLPRVTADQRREYENTHQRLNREPFRIVERDKDGKFRPADRRREYFPATYIEPAYLHRVIFGLDFAADPAFGSVMEQAREIGNMTAAPTRLAGPGQPVQTIFRPVYSADKPDDTIAEREKNLIGFIAVSLRMDNLIVDAISGMSNELVNIELLDDLGPDNIRTMVFRHSASSPESGRTIKSLYDYIEDMNYYNLRSEAVLPMQNHVWHLVFTPTSKFLMEQSAWRHVAVFVAGLLITLFIALYSRKSRQYKHELQSLAEYLSACNEELQNEVQAKEQVTTILTDVAETVIAKTGESLYQILVVQLCQTLDVDQAFIGLFCDEAKTHIETIAHYSSGTLKNNFKYPVYNTPCAAVTKGEICIVCENLQEEYSDCIMIKESNAVSYAGIPIQDSDNEVTGILAIMSCSQLKNTDSVRAVLKIFATRISAEIEHERKIRKIRDLAKLHDENPNPVLRADYNGRLLYANMIAVPLLDYWRINLFDTLPAIIAQQCQKCREDHHAIEYEVTCKERIYSLQFNPIRGTDYINIYGRDITDQAQAKATLIERESQLRSMIENAPETIIVFDADTGKLTDFNYKVTEQFGYSVDQLQNITIQDLIPPMQPNGATSTNEFSSHIRATLSNNAPLFEWSFINSSQEELRCEVRLARLPSSEKKLVRASIIDNSWRISTEAQMRKMSQVVEHTADSVVITDRAGIIEYVNPAFEQMTGFTTVEAMGNSLRLIRSDQHDTDFFSTMWQTILDGKTYHNIVINRRKDGSLYYEEKTITPLKDVHNNITNFISTGKDITNRMETEERLHQLANNDLLTSLPNRSSLIEKLNHLLQKRDALDDHHALIILGLDRFKNINETLGHDIGDELLKSLGSRLKSVLRNGDILSRFSGDEFAILVEEIGGERDVSIIAEKITTAMADPLVIRKHELFITASIGASLFPDDGQDAQTLIRHAEMAMSRAKESGRNTFGFYSAEMSERAIKRMQLETSLRRAIDNHEFLIYYQPQIDLQTGCISGAEALLRWQNPDHGLISPLEFIPLLEETGLIVEVGEWLIRTACDQARQWHERFNTGMRISINLSGRQFHSPQLSSTISDALGKNGLNPDALELEITESVLMQDNMATIENLHNLRKLGTRLAIDDFGTGYSSLSYLQRFPVDTLKVDRSFITNVSDSPENMNIVSAIISMAHSLSLDVVAEGVETETQLSILHGMQCNTIQGYLFSPPVSTDDMTDLLQSNRSINLASIIAQQPARKGKLNI